MLAFFSALVCALVLTAVLVPLLRRAQFMDVPNHRSSHALPVPRGGGLAVVTALVAVAALTVDLDAALVGLLVTTALLACVGFADDLRSLPSAGRLLAQVVAAACLAVLLISEGGVSWWWLPIFVLGLASYVNAFNFMDGINGISSLTAAAVGLWWAWAGSAEGHTTLATLGYVLAGVAIGFLPWNAPRARVFLGDVGSYGIGFFVAGLSVLAVSDGFPWWWALAPLVVYGADTGSVLVKRAHAGKPLTEAHREHVYQRLVDRGWPHLASASLCAGATALVCVVTGMADTSLVWWTVLACAAVVVVYLNADRAYASLGGAS